MKHLIPKNCLVAGLLISNHAVALNYELSLSASSRYDNNAELEAAVKQEDTRSALALDIDLEQKGESVNLDASYAINYTDYDKNTNTDRSETRGSSNLKVELLRDRLSWQATHTISELVASRETANTADNRQQRQQFSTGPYLILPVSKVDDISVSAHYTNVLFDEAEETALNNNNTEADTQSYSAALRWFHAVSALTNIVSSYNYQQSERDNTNNELTVQSLSTGFSRSLRSLQYGLQIGGSRAESDLRSKATNGVYYQMELRKNFGTGSLSLSATQQQTDASLGVTFGDILSARSEIPIDNADPRLSQEAFANQDTVEITLYDINFQTSRLCQRCKLNLGYSFANNDYESENPFQMSQTNEDERVNRADISLTYRINRTLSTTLSGDFRHTKFLDDGSADKDSSGRLFFNWNAGRKLTLRLGGGYEQRDTDNIGRDNYYNAYGLFEIDYQLYSSYR